MCLTEQRGLRNQQKDTTGQESRGMGVQKTWGYCSYVDQAEHLPKLHDLAWQLRKSWLKGTANTSMGRLR